MLNFIGLLVSAMIWKEYQASAAVVSGLIFMALGLMVFLIGTIGSESKSKKHAYRLFWQINIWLLSFIPLSFFYNILLFGMDAPYPLFNHPLFYFAFWLVYVFICSVVSVILNRNKK